MKWYLWALVAVGVVLARAATKHASSSGTTMTFSLDEVNAYNEATDGAA